MSCCFFFSPLFPLRSVIQLHHLDVLLKSIMDSWGFLCSSSSFTEYSRCYSNLPTTPSCIGNETRAPTPPPWDHPPLHTPSPKKEVLRWDLSKDSSCIWETKEATDTFPHLTSSPTCVPHTCACMSHGRCAATHVCCSLKWTLTVLLSLIAIDAGVKCKCLKLQTPVIVRDRGRTLPSSVWGQRSAQLL